MLSQKSYSQKLFFFRLFIPSWKFFDEFESLLVLEFRIQTNSNEWSAWQPVFKPAKFKIWNLFFNPEGIYRLAASSLVDQLFQDTQNWDPKNQPGEFHKQSTYRLTRNLIQQELSQRSWQKIPAAFQFRLFTNHQEVLLSNPTPWNHF